MSRTLLSILIVFLVLVGLLFVSNQSQVGEQLARQTEALQNSLSEAAGSLTEGIKNIGQQSEEAVVASQEVAEQAGEKAAVAYKAVGDKVQKVTQIEKSQADRDQQQAAIKQAAAKEAAAEQESEKAMRASMKTEELVRASEANATKAKTSIASTITHPRKASKITPKSGSKDVMNQASQSGAQKIAVKKSAIQKTGGMPKKKFDYSITAGTSSVHETGARILFAYNSSDLTESAEQVLQQIADKLRSDRKLVAQIAGNTDALGPADINKLFSEFRAQSVTDKLRSLGVLQSQLQVAALSSSKPIATNQNWSGRQLNRRVDIVLK